MKQAILTVLAYDVEANDIEDVMTIEDLLKCVGNMTCPFDDDYPPRENISHNIFIDP